MNTTALKLKEVDQTAAHIKPRTVTILGSTGTIGKNTLQLVGMHSQEFQVEALTAHSNVESLAEQAIKFNAKLAVIGREDLYDDLKSLLSGHKIEAAAGSKAILEAASRKVDVAMIAIVGAAGLSPAIETIKQGNIVCMANKECLVCAGDLIMDMAKESGTSLIPVDSEHNTIFQIFDFKRTEEIAKITLTASGGPFWSKPIEELKNVTPEQAVKHPNWNMGAKISVDSATMMNKGLEMIEALRLFPVEHNQIEAIVHPESIIHGMVEFKDGSVSAGLSNPDMKIPISYAMGWPKRVANNVPRLNLAAIGKLEFFEPDAIKFPALKLARIAMQEGGTAPTVLNAANEIAVKSFLTKHIGFLDITKVVEKTLEKFEVLKADSINAVAEADKKAREYSANLIKKI